MALLLLSLRFLLAVLVVVLVAVLVLFVVLVVVVVRICCILVWPHRASQRRCASLASSMVMLQ